MGLPHYLFYAAPNQLTISENTQLYPLIHAGYQKDHRSTRRCDQ
jgi:hypothetical protein